MPLPNYVRKTSRLRDAAVDPEPQDHLPPTNAGLANPHGPLVVAPEIQHEGPKGLKPGDVPVAVPAPREVAETPLAEVVEAVALSEDVEVVVPAASASKAAWVDYAVSQGADREEAETLSRRNLIDQFG